ncbi:MULTISPECIES: LURP-one-related/scramblase family protein [Enterococcus]|uniref:LURP-one-related family protein n=1 Tax=Enterococcus alishanensis TaxID=1303817 RepID=A0ABS6THD8_9ENTE|nr:LURP-one-related family protein [Enterococcus alishanensis]MBV7392306.1 LURP-one-related family protein [Enterococcus alishanensis]
MKTLYIKQKVFSIGEKFTVTDENQQPRFYVNGSFMKIPKTFEITDEQGREVSKITKKTISLLPKFFVEIDGKEMVEIQKKLTFLKAKYEINADGVSVDGNWWDMDFSVERKGKTLAEIHKKWVSWGDTYEIKIFDEDYLIMILSIVIAIDRVKADESANSSSGSSS